MTLIQDTDVKSKAFDDLINSFNQSLWITIYTKLEVDEAFDRLMILDDTWWLEAITSVPKSNLHINLEWESNEI